jgi:magnesium chelatase subunit D
MDDLSAINALETAAASPSDKIAADPWQDALLAARVLAAGGSQIGGLWLKARAGGVRDAYLDHLRALLACSPGWVRVPASVALSALTGSIDIPATALAGRLVHQPGLLARADRGVLLVPMAERLEAPAAALIGAAMESGSCAAGRPNGQPANRDATRFRVIAIDESATPEEHLPPALADRLGLIVDLDRVAWSQAKLVDAAPRATGQVNSGGVVLDDDLLRFLSAVASAAGAPSLRSLQHLARICRILAALDGRHRAGETDALTALRLSLGLAVAPPREAAPECGEAAREDRPPPDSGPETASPPSQEQSEGAEEPPPSLSALSELLTAVEAGTIAGLPEFTSARTAKSVRARSGKSGAPRKDARRGRPVSTSRAAPYPDARPHILATLRAAAPWQQIRSRNRQVLAMRLDKPPAAGRRQPRTLITRDDYRYQRLRHETPSTAIFLVDASGSTALERLGETKGAIEQLLARCYVRRDEVAMIAFRGTSAETVLPPTRSLVMAKRKLAGLPGGGPTPLVAGLERGLDMALSVRRQGSTPVLVLLTDGRGNIALDGSANRTLAADQLTQIATCCRSQDVRSICIDIARRPREAVASLAEAMGADLHILRHADARHMSDVVNASLEEARG